MKKSILTLVIVLLITSIINASQTYSTLRNQQLKDIERRRQLLEQYNTNPELLRRHHIEPNSNRTLDRLNQARDNDQNWVIRNIKRRRVDISPEDAAWLAEQVRQEQLQH